MQILGRITLIAITILLITTLILIVIWPYLQGILLPTRLACGSDAVHCFDSVQIRPGDTYIETLSFSNPFAYPRDYRVAFVQGGSLWSCDGNGEGLDYETSWSPGADLHLEPGETETVAVRVTFPDEAKITCHGEAGHLVVRHYFLDHHQGEGVCACGLPPMPSLLRTAFFGSSDPVNCPCAEVAWAQFEFNQP